MLYLASSSKFEWISSLHLQGKSPTNGRMTILQLMNFLFLIYS